MPCFSIVSNPENSEEKSESLSRKSHSNLIDSDNQLTYRSTSKKSRGSTIVRNFFQRIRFHTQSKDGTNTIFIWSSQTTYYLNDEALQKHESNSPLTWWRYWPLRNSHRRYIRTIFVYTQPRLCASNVKALIKENGFTFLKRQKSRRYPAETITDINYTDDQTLLANTPAQP